MSVFSVNKQEHLTFTIFPTVLKVCLDGIEVAGMHKYFHAIVDSKGPFG